VYGPGNIAHAHAVDERVSIDEIAATDRVLEAAVRRLLQAPSWPHQYGAGRSVLGDEAPALDEVLGVAQQALEVQRGDHAQQLGGLDTAQRGQAVPLVGVLRCRCRGSCEHDGPSADANSTLTPVHDRPRPARRERGSGAVTSWRDETSRPMIDAD
jgi:hypothetical protein